MSDERVVVERGRPRQRGARGISGAIILIALGVAFLLQNLGVVSFDWFWLVRFWPLLLILLGLDLLLGRTLIGSLVSGLVGLILVAGVLYLAAGPAMPGRALSGATVTRDVEAVELGDAEAVTVNLNVGAASVTVDGRAAPGLVVDGRYRTDEELGLQTVYDVREGAGELTLMHDTGAGPDRAGAGLIGEIDLRLTGDVPVDLNVNAGAGSINLNLSELTLRSLTISGGVGAIDVRLPATGHIDVRISGGLGALNLVIPPGLEARVTVEGLTTSSLPPRFEEVADGVWATPGYEGADNRATIDIATGIGTVNIR